MSKLPVDLDADFLQWLNQLRDLHESVIRTGTLYHPHAPGHWRTEHYDKGRTPAQVVAELARKEAARLLEDAHQLESEDPKPRRKP
jgi:hypothetical protein